MFYRINNLIIKQVEYLETENDANIRLAEIQQEYLDQESYRFSVAKEVVAGNNTTWMNADLENDEDNNVYYVFNTITGEHEKAESLSEAKEILAKVKNDFLAFVGLDKWEIVEQKPKTVIIVEQNNMVNNTNEPTTL